MYKSMCFSGHRLDKILELIRSSDIINTKDISLVQSQFLEVIKSIIYIKVTNYIDKGFKKFYIGMSNGIDLWVGEILLELKLTQYPEMEIVAVKPFKNHGSNFSINDKILYHEILKSASQEICLHNEKFMGAYLERNRYMVENTTHLLAFICDYDSGTGYTIKYAKSLNKSVEVINLLSLSNGFIKSYNDNTTFYNMMDYI